MMPIHALLNKIKWDSREKPDEYTLYYHDRVENSLKALKYNDIKGVEGQFIIIDIDGEETHIPMHRIRSVRRAGKLVWERSMPSGDK